jgi:hypothetical protein
MKKIRFVFIAVVGLFLYTSLVASFVRNIYFAQDKGEKWGILSNSVRFMAEIPSTIKTVFSNPEFYVPNSISKDGVNTSVEDPLLSNYQLLVSHKKVPFQQEFDLIDLKSGETLRNWKPDNKALFELAYNSNNPRKPAQGSDLYFMHPLMLEDYSLIFNSQLSSLLVRIDKDSQVIWSKNDRTYHHTTEMDSEGMIWACTRPFISSEYPFFPENDELSRSSLSDDSLTRLNPATGEIIYNKPVLEILIENGFKSLVLQKGQIISDPIHLNDIQPALIDSEYWKKGDLLISCRNLSTVFLFRPSTEKIIWLKQGPWQNQHDVDFVNTKEISIFGNDIIREESTLDPKLSRKNLYFTAETPYNQIYLYNFDKDSVESPYRELMVSENINTITSGRSEILENGNIFLEDTNNGRIIFGDSIMKKIEYTKRIDENHISTLFWSRILKK